MKKEFILIGHPVGHSISPSIHEAAYRALGLSGHTYRAVDCADETQVARQVDALRRGELAGANVTVPWKRVALDLADEAEPLARDTGAANVLALVENSGERRVVAYNTDVLALATELRDRRPQAKRALVIGSGGAALAAVVACRSIGVRETFVIARKWKAASDDWPRAAEFSRLGATPLQWPGEPPAAAAFEEFMATVDVLVQSTSAGMKGAEPGDAVRDIAALDRLRSDAFVYDLVYNPPVTPILQAADERGIACSGGLGMLVGQAAKALEIWLGVPAPLSAMRAAAERALFEDHA